MKPRARHALAAAAALVVPALMMGSDAQPSSAGIGTSPGRRAAAEAMSPNSSAVRTWNVHAVEAVFNAPNAPVPGAGQTPGVGVQHMAMVQGAVYDAVNSIDRGHEPYLDGLPAAPSTASMEAAVATAAHHVLTGLGGGLVPPLPQVVIDRLDTLYTDALAAIPDGPDEDAGISAGAAAAAAMLAERADDRRYVPFSFIVGDEPGEWRPTPPANANDPFAWVARVEPFGLDNPTQLRTQGPPAPRSAQYAKEYNEVKNLGAIASLRTAAQQALADFYTVNPQPMYNRTFRAISQAEGLTLVEEARLFAMLNLASADSLISCHANKAWWSNWRPITAIHEGDNDGNRRTAGDPTWTSHTANPPYPDNPSGYNCTTAAFMHTAKAFFGGDRMDFSVVKVAPPAADVTRHYKRFTDVVRDTIDARVYQGIHFRSADVQGARLGKAVANVVTKNHFRPVD